MVFKFVNQKYLQWLGILAQINAREIWKQLQHLSVIYELHFCKRFYMRLSFRP